MNPAAIRAPPAAAVPSAPLPDPEPQPEVPGDSVDVPFEEIALLDVSSGAFTYGEQNKTDAVMERLRKEAAKVGANGVIFGGTARGYGKAHPVADNASPEGRAMNRRVEIVIADDMGTCAGDKAHPPEALRAFPPALAPLQVAGRGTPPSHAIEPASLNLKCPFGLSLSKPRAALRQAQRERFK